jgi:hypothetical protein
MLVYSEQESVETRYLKTKISLYNVFYRVTTEELNFKIQKLYLRYDL